MSEPAAVEIVWTWKGVRIEDLSREELVDAVIYSAGRIRKLEVKAVDYRKRVAHAAR